MGRGTRGQRGRKGGGVEWKGWRAEVDKAQREQGSATVQSPTPRHTGGGRRRAMTATGTAHTGAHWWRARPTRAPTQPRRAARAWNRAAVGVHD